QIAIEIPIARDRDTDCGRDQSVRLAGSGFGHHDERDLPRLEQLHALTAGEDAALRRKNAGDAYQVTRGDAGGTQRELERGELFPVFADTLREEHLLRDESDHVTLLVAAASVHGTHQHSHCQGTDLLVFPYNG